MKAKFCSILLLSLCCASVAGAAQSAVSERYDFSKGIPSDFILIDNDGNTPSVDVTRYGFSVGTPWVSHYVEKEDNYVAASTSWYAASGTSDDWMILPQFTVADADAVVSWRAKADNAMFSDGYAVYISEGGGEISDFDKLKPLFTVAAEQAEWTFHSVSLADYVGKTVRVAFVNNSTDCSMLYVDDIMIGTPATVRIEHTMRPLVKPSDEIVIQGNVSTDLAEPVKGFTLGYGYGGIVRTQSFTDTVLQPGETLPIQPKPIADTVKAACPLPKVLCLRTAAMPAGMSLTDDLLLTALSAACTFSNAGDTQSAAPVSAAAFRKPRRDISIRLSLSFFMMLLFK